MEVERVTVRVPVQYDPFWVAPPGLEPQPPRCNATEQILRPFGLLERLRVETVGRYQYELVFDFVPTTQVGRYLLHCLQTGTAEVKHMNPAPFETAQVRFSFACPAWLMDEYEDLDQACVEGRWATKRATGLRRWFSTS